VNGGIFVLRGKATEEELAGVAAALRAIGEEVEQRRGLEQDRLSPSVTALRACPSPGPDAWWSSQFQLT
jgi:hypothetical protein